MRSPDGNIFENVHAPLEASADLLRRRPVRPRPEPEEPPFRPPLGRRPTRTRTPTKSGYSACGSGARPGRRWVGLVLASLVVARSPACRPRTAGVPRRKSTPVTLPTSAPLKDGQLIVAAGNRRTTDLHVYRFDRPGHPARAAGASHEQDPRSGCPVAEPGPARPWCSRAGSRDSDNQLCIWTAGVERHESAPALRPGARPTSAAVSTGRPAWIPARTETRCSSAWTTVASSAWCGVDVHGNWLAGPTTMVRARQATRSCSSGTRRCRFDGPNDGAVRNSDRPEDRTGRRSLYAIDCASQAWPPRVLRGRWTALSNYSDAASSRRSTNTLA